MQDLFILFGSYVFGMALLFLYHWNLNNALRINDVLITYALSAAIGLVFAYAGYKANISHWLIWILYAAAAAFITNKLLDKKQLL